MTDVMPSGGVPRHVQLKAGQLGQAGAIWLTRRPETLGHRGHRWPRSIGDPLAGGTAAYVVPVRRADGRAAAQAVTLARAEGRSCVKPLDRNDDVLAMPWEPLEHPSTRAPESQIHILCETLAGASGSCRGESSRRGDGANLDPLPRRGYERRHPPISERALTDSLPYGDRRAEALDLVGASSCIGILIRAMRCASSRPARDPAAAWCLSTRTDCCRTPRMIWASFGGMGAQRSCRATRSPRRKATMPGSRPRPGLMGPPSGRGAASSGVHRTVPL